MIDDVTGRISQGINRARLALEARRASRPLAIVLVGLAVAAVGGAWLAGHVSSTLLGGTYTVRFAVPDASGVVPNVDRARFRGITAGSITGLDREGSQLVLTAKFDKDYGPVYRDLKAVLRPQTPLDDMYLDIVDPGTPSAGKVTGIVPESQIDTSVDIGDVLQVFGSDERTRLGQLLDNLGNGMKDGGVRLRTAVAEITPFLKAVAGITDQVALRKRETRRLVHNLTLLTGELGRREKQLRTLVRDGSATFGTLQAGSADLDATLRELPGTFSTLQASFSRVRGVLDDVDGAVESLQPVADRLPAALTTVRRLQPDLDRAVRRLAGPVRRLVPLARSLVPVASGLDEAFAALQPQAHSINKITDAVNRCLDPIRGFFQWNASLSKYGDARGPIPRGNLAFGVPDTGVLPARRTPGENCVPGHAIGGRVPTPEDEG